MREDKIQRQRMGAGRCGNCGSRPPKRGCTDCVPCLRRKALTQIDLRLERRERGLCPECGLRKLADRWGCAACVARHRESQRRRRLKAREAR
jgi:hypothetical protein